MKLRKIGYFLLLILVLTIGVDKVNASESKTCYYMIEGGDFKASLTLYWDAGTFEGNTTWWYSHIYIDQWGGHIDHEEEKRLLNWIEDGGTVNTIAGGKITFSDYHDSISLANSKEPDCPQNLVFQDCSEAFLGQLRVWGTESETEAGKAVKYINKEKNCKGYYGKNDLGDGEITAEEYYGSMVDLDGGGSDAPLDCPGLLGDKTDDGDAHDVGGDGVASIAYLINEIMLYVRIIVPILLIVLGMIDLARAVVAGKEDAMKAAQLTFVKRIIAGVCVFFSPLLVNIIMWLAEIVWDGLGYSACQL